jgi:hypothetical protein
MDLACEPKPKKTILYKKKKKKKKKKMMMIQVTIFRDFKGQFGFIN